MGKFVTKHGCLQASGNVCASQSSTGKIDANECAGLIVMSMVPAAGSPDGCACSVVTMGTAYTPGSLVKCENCKDVSRSRDANSCPKGTKLFSPRSRADWESFINAAQPLRAPNFIIDVTRPQNGCSGCTQSVTALPM